MAAAIGLVLLSTSLPETRPPESAADSSLGSALAAYGVLLRDPHFLGLVLIGAFGMASFFVYLANSSFVLINHYGLTPRQYSLAFCGQCRVLHRRLAAHRPAGGALRPGAVVRVAVVAYAAAMVVLAGSESAGRASSSMSCWPCCCSSALAFWAWCMPSTAVLALEGHGADRRHRFGPDGHPPVCHRRADHGVVGLFVDGSARPMAAGIAACALLAFAVARATLGQGQPVVVLAGAPK